MKKGVTLIELMVVIVVLGILTAIAMPNIKNVKSKASLSSAFENKTNVQKGIDRYFLEKQSFPTQSQPSVGNPVLIDWTQLEPPYLIKRPQDIDKFYYWVDSFGTVWMSDIDAPTNPSMTGTGTVDISFDENPNAVEYQVGYIDVTAFRDTSNLNAISAYTWAKKGQKGDGNFVASGSKVQTTLPESDLNGKVLVISAVSKNGLQTAPVTVGYRGTELPTDITKNAASINQKPVAVITMTPNAAISNTTNITWSHASSSDPDGDTISAAEWQLDSNSITSTPASVVSSVGLHVMKLRVKDSKGLWSDWVSKSFNVSIIENVVLANFIGSNSNFTFSNGNLTAQTNNAGEYGKAESTIIKTAGKWYAEIKIDNAGSPAVATSVGMRGYGGADDVTRYFGNRPWEYAYVANGNKANNYIQTAYGASYGTGDVIGIALDMDNATLGFYKNGVYQGIAYTGVKTYLSQATIAFGAFGGYGGKLTANFGASPFQYPVPDGYLPYNNKQ